MTKLLIIRFSSIGDIVLTTPLLRAIKLQQPDITIHYLTKKSYSAVLEHNTNIDKLILLDESLFSLIKSLKKEKYDYIIDLHKNLRTAIIKSMLCKPSKSFRKLNWEKFLLVRFKWNKMPEEHIVDRYFQALECFSVFNDKKGLEYFNGFTQDIKQLDLWSRLNIPEKYVALVVGGTYATKQIPLIKLQELVSKIESPVVLLGGKNDVDIANQVAQNNPEKVVVAAGLANLNESAQIIKQSLYVVTGDTGLMHIAAAYEKKIFSVWGNTVPEFGMYPYMPQHEEFSTLLEVKNLKCRPCSKLGFSECPQKHFDCMLKQDFSPIYIYDKSLNINHKDDNNDKD